MIVPSTTRVMSYSTLLHFLWESLLISVPVLIVPRTRYNTSVTLILGTNVLHHFKTSESTDIPTVGLYPVHTPVL